MEVAIFIIKQSLLQLQIYFTVTQRFKIHPKMSFWSGRSGGRLTSVFHFHILLPSNALQLLLGEAEA